METLRQNRINRSDACWNDAGVMEISKASRLNLYFDSVFLGLLGVLYHTDTPILTTDGIVNVETVFQDAGQFMDIQAEDIGFGLDLADAVLQFDPGAINSKDLEAVRDWAYRLRKCILIAELEALVSKKI